MIRAIIVACKMIDPVSNGVFRVHAVISTCIDTGGAERFSSAQTITDVHIITPYRRRSPKRVFLGVDFKPTESGRRQAKDYQDAGAGASLQPNNALS